MISIDFCTLNPLEKEIHKKLSKKCETTDNLRITEAAKICGCSVSKISKFIKKLGFENYKQYLFFLYEKKIPKKNNSSELKRIQNFIQGFDASKVNELKDLISRHSKIVLFGYGPSLLCAQYFEYRLRTCTNKMIIATQDDLSIASMTDKDTLLLFFTVTGAFKSFEKIYYETKKKGK